MDIIFLAKDELIDSLNEIWFVYSESWLPTVVEY